MKQKKILVTALVLGAVTLSAASAGVGSAITAALRPDIQVRVDGQLQELKDKNGRDLEPILYQGATYLPVRAVGELMGLEVSWDKKTQTVELDHPEEKPEDKPIDKPAEKPAVKPAERPGEDLLDRDAAFYQSRLKTLTQKADQLLADCGAERPSRALLIQLEELEDQADRLEDAIEDSGKLNRQDCRQLLRDLDRTEDVLDRAEDRLELAGLDDDD